MLLSSDQKELKLDPVGQMEGECEELVVEGQITHIWASYKESEGVSAIQYQDSRDKTEYNKLRRKDITAEWLFDD